MTIIEELESQLGNNLHLLRDKLDLQIRQGDQEVLTVLQEITQAWETIALLAATERKAKQGKLYFNAVQDGYSVIDSLFHYATELYPRSAPVQRKMNTVV